MKLLALPPELVEEILILCDPIDVSKAAQTCCFFRWLVYFAEDSKLWRELYLGQGLDDPRVCVGEDGVARPGPLVEWRKELQGVIRARTVVGDVTKLRSCWEGERVLRTLMRLVSYVRPWRMEKVVAGRRDSRERSKNLEWMNEKLQQSGGGGGGGFLDRVGEKVRSSAGARQLVARLHTYYGMTERDGDEGEIARSRAFVYWLRNYRAENEYGPFEEDGRVDWVHVRAIHHVVSRHLVGLEEEEEEGGFPMRMCATQICLPREGEEEMEDWAGVTGSWNVSFCFCDHRELLRFNVLQLNAQGDEFDTSLFEQPGFREVFRSLNVKLCVAGTEEDPLHPTRPVIHFFGEMHDPSTSTMTGWVKMTTDRQVRWHFVSGDQGNAIWSSEGVQVGGLRSAFGVLGSWTTIFHDADDPVGPFWMHKLKPFSF